MTLKELKILIATLQKLGKKANDITFTSLKKL
mgnify:CR=1 FL=1